MAIEPVTPKKPTPEKIKPYTPEWERMADDLARNFCPEINPCRHCGGPVISGYCCDRCGSSSP